MPELHEYEIDDPHRGTITVQLTEDDAKKRYPDARRTGTVTTTQQDTDSADETPEVHEHTPVQNRARK